MVVNLCPEKCSKSIQYTVRKSQKVRQSNERNIISSVVTSKPQSHGYICESAFVLLLHSKHHGLTVFALNTKTLGCPPKCMFFSPRWTQVRSLENITQYAACSLISVLHFSAILATLLEWIDLSKLFQLPSLILAPNHLQFCDCNRQSQITTSCHGQYISRIFVLSN